MDFIFLVLLLTLIFTPTIFCPIKLADGYILPQAAIASLGVGICSLGLLSLGIVNLSFTSILTLLLFVYLMCSNSWSTCNHNSLQELPLIFSSFFVFILFTSIYTYERLVILSLIVSSVSVFTSLYAIGQRFRFDPLFPERVRPRDYLYKGKNLNEIDPNFRNEKFIDSRAISTLGNTNFAAGYFVATLPFIAIISYEISYWFLIYFLITSGGIVATRSRAGILGLFVFSFSFLLFLSTKGLVFDFLFRIFGNLNSLQFSIYLLVWGLLSCQLWVLAKKNPLKFLSDTEDKTNTILDLEYGSDTHWNAHIRYRWRYIRAAFHLIKKRWFRGFGLRSYRREVYGAQGELHQIDVEYNRRNQHLKRSEFLSEQYQTPQPREVHCDIVENFVEGGIVFGLGFLLILGVILYHGSFLGSNFFLLSIIVSGVLAILANSMFFFSLRLAPSAILFWILLAAVEGITRNTEVIGVEVNWIILALAILAFITFWIASSLIPNLANYYFTKYTFSSSRRKMEYLDKAIKLMPRASIFRTYALIAYLDTNPEFSELHAEVLRNHYDGMVPAWTMFYNCGIVKKLRRHYQDAGNFFEQSLYLLPRFEASQNELNVISQLTPLKRRGILAKQLTGEGVQAVAHYNERINATKEKMNALQQEAISYELSIGQIILAEKTRLNIPANWVFHIEENLFLAPTEINDAYELGTMGPGQIPVAKTKR